ncbi:unnamed protein product [Caenorhabditis angaria]|uniref:AXH domain-containing protein n=1 Tax=Caenorhabditis angaria TaxID=860376 RepID=A0A9P1MTT9_9PELO|nr:unnamed protein product [Caenorhabditis angaria]
MNTEFLELLGKLDPGFIQQFFGQGTTQPAVKNEEQKIEELLSNLPPTILQQFLQKQEVRLNPLPSSSTSFKSQQNPNFEMGSICTDDFYYPTHFLRGTKLELSDGSIKKVEDLSSDDFLKCAVESKDVNVTASIIKDIVKPEKNRATSTILFETSGNLGKNYVVELLVQNEHPFFVLGKGWASCDVRKTAENYGLQAGKLEIGDVCIVLTRHEDSENDDEIVDIITAQRDLEEYSRKAAWREQILPIYRELSSINGRRSAPPSSFSTKNQPRKRKFSENQ